MSQLSPNAQALIDRLARMDPARPRQDRSAVERALRSWLNPLTLRRRRFVWMDDGRAGFRYVAEQGSADGLAEVVLITIDRVWVFARLVLVIVMGGLAAFLLSAPMGLAMSWLAGDRTGMALRDLFGAPTATSTLAVVVLLGAFYAALVWRLLQNARRRRAAVRPINGLLSAMRPTWDVATIAVAGESSEISVFDYWRHVRNNVPFAAHHEAHREVLTSLGRSVTGSQMFPMTEAFEAGLFLYWVRPREVVCVPQPAFRRGDDVPPA